MTWFFDADDSTILTVEFDDGQGNVTTVATDIPFSGGWSGPAPDKAIREASNWIIDRATEGNTQQALTGLAELVDGRWQEGTA